MMVAFTGVTAFGYTPAPCAHSNTKIGLSDYVKDAVNPVATNINSSAKTNTPAVK